MIEGWHQRFLCLILIAHVRHGWSDRNSNPWASLTSERQQCPGSSEPSPGKWALYRAAWVWGGQGCPLVLMGWFQSFPWRKTFAWARTDPGDVMSKSWFGYFGIIWTNAVPEAYLPWEPSQGTAPTQALCFQQGQNSTHHCGTFTGETDLVQAERLIRNTACSGKFTRSEIWYTVFQLFSRFAPSRVSLWE